MSDTKMNPEYEAKLEALKAEWVGQHVKILGSDHPHFGKTGVVSSFDHTNAGWAVSFCQKYIANHCSY